MKTIATLTVLAAAAFVSIAAQAQSADALSRNEVTAELERARSGGELDFAHQELNGPSAAIVRTTAPSPAQPVAASDAKRLSSQTHGTQGRAAARTRQW